MNIRRLGLIAGNGPLPLQVLDEARRRGLPVTVVAAAEEADPALDEAAGRPGPEVTVHWLGVGRLNRMIEVFRSEGVDHALMVGQVKHTRIFARGSRFPLRRLKHLPDLRMLKLLASLKRRNTASLIEAVIRELEREGIAFLDSTLFLQPILAHSGVMTRRAPDDEEQKDFEYGRPVALELARLDIGQTIVVKEQAVVAVEAMEGTDATIRRAAELAGGERLTVIKVSRPHQDMRFDVPVVGPRTLEVLQQCAVSALAVDAGRTLMIDKPALLEKADQMNLTIVGFPT